MYTYDEKGEEVKAMTDAELYNLTDDISHLAKCYAVGCREEATKHTKKALAGFYVTAATALIGFLYTMFHGKAASYYSGAEIVYSKYTNLAEDAEDFEKEYRELDETVRKQQDRF